MVLSEIVCSLYILYFLMSDISDRTVTSYSCPSTADHLFGFYYACNKESTTIPVQAWMAILLQPVEYNENTNLYYDRYSPKCSFTVKYYLSIMYCLVIKATI